MAQLPCQYTLMHLGAVTCTCVNKDLYISLLIRDIIITHTCTKTAVPYSLLSSTTMPNNILCLQHLFNISSTSLQQPCLTTFSKSHSRSLHHALSTTSQFFGLLSSSHHFSKTGLIIREATIIGYQLNIDRQMLLSNG